ncbi:MAG: MoaD/ThiS family protein [Desulfobacteraceae bacterium]|nr:MAG: MoaD/ThiS family protein [Desulfobacteraceae bacterium]
MNNIHIQLELLATLKRFQPDSPGHFAVPEGTDIRRLAGILEIPEYEINLIFIDGVKGNLQSRLSGGERVSLFPPLDGG